MAFDLIATVTAGFALAGVALILRSLTRGRLPGWLVPLAAGAGMLSFAIWNEYTWYPRMAATLPEGVVIARVNEETAIWRPWTFLRPIVTRFSAVDTRRLRTSAAAPGQVLAPVVLVSRWTPAATIPVLFDCEAHRRAALTGDALVPAPGDPAIAWEAVAEGDEVLLAACGALPA